MISTVEINLDWYRDAKGYQLDAGGRFPNRVVAKGGPLEPIYPLIGPTFATFANVRSPAQLIKFMNAHGYLRATSYETDDPQKRSKLFGERATIDQNENGQPVLNFANAITLVGEDVDGHLEIAALFRSLISHRGVGTRTNASHFSNMESFLELVRLETLGDVTVMADRRGELRAKLVPPSLLSGMCVQLLEDMRRKSSTRVCALPTCEKVFQVGAGSGKRLDARFCRERHRIAFHSRNRSVRQ